MRVMRSIQDTLADHDWSRNLRELKNFTERCSFAGGEPGEPARRRGGLRTGPGARRAPGRPAERVRAEQPRRVVQRFAAASWSRSPGTSACSA